jgi:hypothetical protein
MTTTIILLIIYSSTISDPPTVVIGGRTYCISISICSISFLDRIGGPARQPGVPCGLTSLLFVVDLRFLSTLQNWYKMVDRRV